MKETINLALELVKIRITFAVTITTFMGYVLAAQSVSFWMLIPIFGTLLLACGSAVFNHLQESDADTRMDRTRHRPLPSGKISPLNAFVFGILLVLSGSILLIASAGAIALGLGFLAMFWYNGVYTPLKKKHPFAVIPGSLIGAIPPAIGWVAGGGDIFDERILAVSFFFFVWQIPHFWLLMLFFDRDYKQAGFPTLQQLFTKDQILRIIFIWMVGVCVMSIGLPLYGIVHAPAIFALLILGAGWLTWKAYRFLISSKNDMNLIDAFKGINKFALFVVFLISIDTLLAQ